MSIVYQTSGLGLSVQAREDGSLQAAYLRISDKQVARTEEVVESVLLIDFDHDGQLVGIEILAPVQISQVMELANRLDASQRQSFKNFVKSSAPPALVLT
ncbi:MAG TPA: DUF2283 domain-containing protein [Pirellulales bacterium]|nr:DUF2283 domain-containing protein [Pirellulales bacterium]